MDEKSYKTEIIKDPKTTFDFYVKVLVLGDAKVGKTSILNQLTENNFSQEYIPTKGYKYKLCFIKVNNLIMKFQLWDMCGEENYRPNALLLYRNANLGILVYSISSKESFDNLDNWITQMKEKSPYTKIILLGNKSDENDKREVSYEEGKEMCKKHNLYYFTEISAANEINSPSFLEVGAIWLYKEYENNPNDVSVAGMSESILLEPPKKRKKLFC